MTALIGGSILLIIVASVSLVMGWASTNEPLIYTSITSSVASFVCLALAYYRSKGEARKIVAAADVAEGVDPLVDEEPADDQLVDASAEALAKEAEAEADEETPLAGTQAIDVVTDDEPSPGLEPEPEPEPTPEPEASTDDVVAFAQRRRYHRPECRYASAGGGERMSKAAAVTRGYDACRSCKP
ncbi:MAG: hypothetical protein QOG54_1946 [Actinomycetota bacterium]|jgi:Zn-dependent protease with chaperone function|nr:hypothetical protein [Actinomycetota bacterium]